MSQQAKENKGLKRKYFYLGILISTLILYFYSQGFKSKLTSLLIFFTSNSKDLMVGRLKSFGNLGPIKSIGLMVLQALVFPFSYENLVIANSQVFGRSLALPISFIGRLLGALLTFDISKVFLSVPILKIFSKLKQKSLLMKFRKSRISNLLIRLVPVNFGFMSYAGGALGMDFKKYLGYSAISIGITSSAYTFNEGYFPYSQERIIFFLRLFLCLVLSIKFIRAYGKIKFNN